MLADLLPQLMATKLERTDEGKVCGRCNEWKPNEAFHVCNRDKRQRWCGDCQRAYLKDWRSNKK